MFVFFFLHVNLCFVSKKSELTVQLPRFFLVFVLRTQIIACSSFCSRGTLCFVQFTFSPHYRWVKSSQNVTCSPHLVKYVGVVSLHLCLQW